MEQLSNRFKIILLIFLATCIIHLILFIVLLYPFVHTQQKRIAPTRTKTNRLAVRLAQAKKTEPQKKPEPAAAHMKSRPGNVFTNDGETIAPTVPPQPTVTAKSMHSDQAQQKPTETSPAIDNKANRAISPPEPADTVQQNKKNDSGKQNTKTVKLKPSSEPNTEPQQPTPARPTLPTLAQLTQSILSYHKNPGTDIADMKGEKGVPPSVQQLKIAYYVSKIQACVLNAMHTHRPPSSHLKKARLDLSITFNRNGSLHMLTIVRTSGDHAIDEYARILLQDASKNFPPFPASWTEERWTMQAIMKIPL